jgi:drug/metabolite transporter (DMT)-like permease
MPGRDAYLDGLLAVPAGAAWGAVIFHEHLSLYYFLAMLLMFIGMFLTEYGRARA